ncbi:MAG: hypothetical protein WKF77_04045 [Planctomycetaceae bacterium]
MNAITAIVRNGRFETHERVNLPDGTEVRLWIESATAETDELPPTPEEIARTLAAMEKVEPFILTAEESDAEMIRQQADKAWEKSQFEQRGEHLRKIWE